MLSLTLALTATVARPASAEPQLHCDVTYAGTTHRYDARISHDSSLDPASDPGAAYTTESADIAGRFRFKAVLLGTGQQLEAVKLYAYYETARHPILLQEVKYVAPFIFSSKPNSLTGLVALYSPPLDRELQYGCSLMEVQQ